LNYSPVRLARKLLGGRARLRVDDPHHNDPTAVMVQARQDIGETLIEVVLTIVIIGLTVGSLLSALAAAGNAGNAQRWGVQADSVLRNYAAAIKTATQACTAGAAYTVVYTPPAPFSVSGGGTTCPAVTPAAALLTLTVIDTKGHSDSVVMRTRTP
jgi:Tfp pilus assembly protein PilV